MQHRLCNLSCVYCGHVIAIRWIAPPLVETVDSCGCCPRCNITFHKLDVRPQKVSLSGEAS